MSLQTPDDIRKLQRKLYLKAKAEPAFRFYLLYDKICREDILRHAYALAHANWGAPGVDGATFTTIEAAGLEEWLAGLRKDLVGKTYRPEPVRRGVIPQPRGGGRPLGHPATRGGGVPTPAQLVLEASFGADLRPPAHPARPRRSGADADQEGRATPPRFFRPSFKGSPWRNTLKLALKGPGRAVDFGRRLGIPFCNTQMGKGVVPGGSAVRGGPRGRSWVAVGASATGHQTSCR